MLPTISGGSDSENVQFNILLEAAQALKELEYLRTDAVSLQEVFDAVQAKVSKTAEDMGVSFAAMERQFKDVIKLSKDLNTAFEAMGPANAQKMLENSPILRKLSDVQSPFLNPNQAAGWAEVNAIQREILK